ncbi:MAG: hypothetical protein HY748_05220 [Elusimicrobia bacterium]|nr:hypothetical protein [Elusimicrobiota bacterium]
MAVNAYTFRAERLYHQSLSLLEAGQYERALEGFMDVLLEDPSYPGAKEQMRKAAREAVKREWRASRQERDALMEEIRNLAGPSDGAWPAGPGAGDIAGWKASLDKALALAQDPADLEKAFRAYAKAMAKTPVTYRAMQMLSTAKSELQKKVLEHHPAMGEDPKWKGKWPGSMKTGELVEAVLLERYNTLAWSESDKDMVTRPARREDAQRIRELAAEIDDSEKAKSGLLWTAVQAFHQFKKDRFQESAKLWNKVLEEDPQNAEATFYLSRVEAAMKAAEPKRVSAYARPDKVEPIAWPSAPAEPEAAPQPRARNDAAVKAKPGAAQGRRATRPVGQEPAQPKPSADKPSGRSPAPVDPAVMQEWGQDLYRRGLKAYSLGKLDEAIEYWNNCLGVYPDHPKAKKALERAMREKK